MSNEAGSELPRAVGTKVQHVDPALEQDPGDEEMPVTDGRVLFTAHHCHAVAGAAPEQPIDPGGERRQPGQASVEHVPVGVVAGGIPRAPAELFPQERVADSRRVQCPPEDRLVELTVPTGERLGADVRHDVDLRRTEELDETFDAVVRVADRPEALPGHHGRA